MLRQSIVLLSAAMLASVAGCSRSGVPQPGDVVSPEVIRTIQWTAGESSDIWAALAATNEAGESRQLGFAASPINNPLATVVFYGADGETVGEDEVELTERC